MRYRDQFSRKRKPQGAILDQFSKDSIGRSKEITEALGKYHWDFYCDLAIQRYRVLSAIKEALLEASNKEYRLENWQRVVRWEYSDAPLSSKGSIKDPAGGRFNIGDIDTTRFPPFPALYIAKDKDTALQEALMGRPGIVQQNLTGYDLALTNPMSIAIVSVSGYIESVIDLESGGKSLKKFVDIIKDFEIEKELFEKAKAVGEPPPELIQTTDQFVKAALDNQWRQMPMFFEIPSPSQIFGQLVAESGIGGIVYPSTHTKKSCISIFPQNFKGTGSFIQLDDTPPNDSIQRRIDAQNWQKLS